MEGWCPAGKGIYPATPDYVHALEVRQPSRWLYIAGTMGLRDDGSAPETVEEQLELIWNNIRAAARERALGSRRVPTTAIVVQTLAPEWLVEIEAIAMA